VIGATCDPAVALGLPRVRTVETAGLERGLFASVCGVNVERSALDVVASSASSEVEVSVRNSCVLITKAGVQQL